MSVSDWNEVKPRSAAGDMVSGEGEEHPRGLQKATVMGRGRVERTGTDSVAGGRDDWTGCRDSHVRSMYPRFIRDRWRRYLLGIGVVTVSCYRR